MAKDNHDSVRESIPRGIAESAKYPNVVAITYDRPTGTIRGWNNLSYHPVDWHDIQ
jgi:hypothetical protein